MRGISWLAEDLLFSQEGLCLIQLVGSFYRYADDAQTAIEFSTYGQCKSNARACGLRLLVFRVVRVHSGLLTYRDVSNEHRAFISKGCGKLRVTQRNVSKHPKCQQQLFADFKCRTSFMVFVIIYKDFGCAWTTCWDTSVLCPPYWADSIF